MYGCNYVVKWMNVTLYEEFQVNTIVNLNNVNSKDVGIL